MRVDIGPGLKSSCLRDFMVIYDHMEFDERFTTSS